MKMLKDDRKVVKTEDGKFRFSLVQEQEYDVETVESMVKSWKERKGEYEAWLDNYERTKKEAVKRLNLELQSQREKIKKDLDFINEGIKLWSV